VEKGEGKSLIVSSVERDARRDGRCRPHRPGRAPLEVKLHCFQLHRLPEAAEKEFGGTFHADVEEMSRSVTLSRSMLRFTLIT
jgi:hypothetical protein